MSPWRLIRFLLRKEPAGIGATLVFSVGLAMIYGDDFVVGIVAIAIAGIWGIGAWLVSDELHRRKPQCPNKPKYIQVEKYKHKYRQYLCWKFSIPSVIISALALSGLFVNEKRTEKLLKEYQGLLLPADDPNPPTACAIDKNLFLVNFGPMSAGADKFPNIVFSSGGIPRMTLDSDGHGGLAVTTDIFDENENILVSIVKNKFIVTNDAFQMERPDKSTLIVIVKHRKERVLDVRFLNKQSMRIYGHFRYPHAPDLIASAKEVQVGPVRIQGSGNCAANPGPGMPDFSF